MNSWVDSFSIDGLLVDGIMASWSDGLMVSCVDGVRKLDVRFLIVDRK